MSNKIKKQICWLLYNVFIIPILSVLLLILKVFNKKVKERESFHYFNYDYYDKLEKFKLQNKIENPTIIWFHSASMGEFEQAKPIIELLKTENNSNSYFIIVSFFSPSGYKNQLNYNFADIITYLPFDSVKNVKKFINFYQPDLAVFVRYDVWFNYLYYLKENKIKSILISGTISSKYKKNSNNLFNSLKLFFYTSLLNNINTIFAANQKEYNSFTSLNLTSEVIKSGDTRIDRILQIVKSSKLETIFDKSIFYNKKVIIIGSAWEEEIELLEHLIINYSFVLEKYQFIIVPHETDKKNITKIKLKIENLEISNDINKFKIETILFSDFETNKNIITQNKRQIIIVDSIGKLLRLYGIADIAIIGGGFKTGLHSVLEPAGFGLPIICGHKLEKQVDAFKLIQLGGLFVINDKNNFKELKTILDSLDIETNYKNVSQSNLDYILQNEGYSRQIHKYINHQNKSKPL